MMTIHVISTRLKQLRELHEVTQKQVAKAIKVPDSDYIGIEDSKVEPKLSDMLKLCIFFNISADYLLGLIDEQTPIFPNRVFLTGKELLSAVEATLNSDNPLI